MDLITVRTGALVMARGAAVHSWATAAVVGYPVAVVVAVVTVAVVAVGLVGLFLFVTISPLLLKPSALYY